MTASLVLLDNVIRVLGLTCIDADNPRSPIFLEYAVPGLGRCTPEAGMNEPSHHPLRSIHQQHQQNFPQVVYHTTTHPTPFDSYREVAHYPPVNATTGCPCQSLSLGSVVTPSIRSSTPLWLLTPKWDAYDLDRDYGEIRKEESRRLVWSTLTMVGGDRGARLALEQPQLDLHLAKPENVSPELSCRRCIQRLTGTLRPSSMLYCILEKPSTPPDPTSTPPFRQKSTLDSDAYLSAWSSLPVPF